MAWLPVACTCLFAAIAAAHPAVVIDERIRALGLDVATIVPMHGVPVGPAELSRGLEIRRKYQETGR